MKRVEEFYARGHNRILATHRTTFEITKAAWLTVRGDCVIAVSSTKAPIDFSSAFRGLCRNHDARITIELRAGGGLERIVGRGDENLTLAHPQEMVGRKSTFVSDRTFMVESDKAAYDMDRKFVKSLKNPLTIVKVTLTAEI